MIDVFLNNVIFIKKYLNDIYPKFNRPKLIKVIKQTWVFFYGKRLQWLMNSMGFLPLTFSMFLDSGQLYKPVHSLVSMGCYEPADYCKHTDCCEPTDYYEHGNPQSSTGHFSDDHSYFFTYSEDFPFIVSLFIVYRTSKTHSR